MMSRVDAKWAERSAGDTGDTGDTGGRLRGPMGSMSPVDRVSRRRLLGASLVGGSAIAAACAPGRSDAPAADATPAVVRVLVRKQFDNDAWKAFDATQPRIAVEPEPGPDQTAAYGARILALAASDSLPDVMYTHPNFFSSLASIKVLADVEKLATRDKFDLKGIQSEFLDSVRWNGTLYSLPYSGVVNVVVYNASQFQKYGVALPPDQKRAGTWTWEGFRASLQRMTVRNPELPAEVGMPQHFTGLQYMSQWVFANGGQMWSNDHKQCLLNSPLATAALDFLAQLHHRDLVAIQPHEREEFGGSVQEGFPTGRVALRFRATTELHFYKEMGEQGARLGVASVPRGVAGPAPRGAASSWAIWSQSKVPNAAWQAIAGWHADPVLALLYSNRSEFPVRASQFDHSAFKAALFPWEDLEVERTALREVRIMDTPARFTEIDAAWGRLWPQARDGRKSVRDVIAEFLPEANALLSG